jgi:hypothetical protein
MRAPESMFDAWDRAKVFMDKVSYCNITMSPRQMYCELITSGEGKLCEM